MKNLSTLTQVRRASRIDMRTTKSQMGKRGVVRCSGKSEAELKAEAAAFIARLKGARK